MKKYVRAVLIAGFGVALLQAQAGTAHAAQCMSAGGVGIAAVQATTFPWHQASLGVIRKLGMVHVGSRLHEIFGDNMPPEPPRTSISVVHYWHQHDPS